MKRRIVIAGFGALWLQPAGATPASLAAAEADYTGGRPVRDGRVTLDLAPLVDNGNTVPVAVRVASAMTAEDHVRSIALFAELNPNTLVATFQVGPRCGRAQVGTRIRLSTSQQVVALATMNDGSVWRQAVDVVVTLAACIE